MTLSRREIRVPVMGMTARYPIAYHDRKIYRKRHVAGYYYSTGEALDYFRA